MISFLQKLALNVITVFNFNHFDVHVVYVIVVLLL